MAYRRLFTGTLLSTGLITIHHTCLFKTVRMGCVPALVAECGEVSLSRAGYCCLDKVPHHHWYVYTVPIMHHTEKNNVQVVRTLPLGPNNNERQRVAFSPRQQHRHEEHHVSVLGHLS